MAEIAALEGSDIAETNLYSYCNNNPVNKADTTGLLSNWGKVAVGVGVIAAAAILTAATGGAGAGVLVAAVHCVAAGALEGAVIGAVTGAVAGAVEGAVASRITNGNWSGAVDAAWDGMASGFMWGSITGAITGALTSPYCFVAGTAVLTATGAVAIETIRAGDYVWAWDEETGQIALKEVLETYVNETDELIHVHVRGEEIITTPGHPFYAPHKGWTKASDLRAGDILVLVNGEYVVVEQIQHELLKTSIPVYNFSVDGFHTYFVAEICVLVHNVCLVDEGGVRVDVRTSREHGLPHAHVSGNGLNTTVGLNQKPMPNHPPLSRKQIRVIAKNWGTIVNGINKYFRRTV